MTRMRFVLNDPGKADVAGIEGMKAVKGSFTQSGQFQVIIGNGVADFIMISWGLQVWKGCLRMR